jgi:hypothetical protein
MPRDVNGNYTLPAGNPVVSGTIIAANWANTTLQDIAAALTDSLSRSGQGGMTSPMRFADGSIATPGISWQNEPASGWYRAGPSDQRYAIAGADVIRLQPGIVTIPTGRLDVLMSAPGGTAIRAGSNTGDRLLIAPQAAGTGVFIASKNLAESDFEPLVLQGETVDLQARSAANTSLLALRAVAIAGATGWVQVQGGVNGTPEPEATITAEAATSVTHLTLRAKGATGFIRLKTSTSLPTLRLQSASGQFVMEAVTNAEAAPVDLMLKGTVVELHSQTAGLAYARVLQASAVNGAAAYAFLSASTASMLFSALSDTLADVPFNFRTKGIGNMSFASDAGGTPRTIFRIIGSTAAVVNFVQVEGGLTTAPAILRSAGEANAPLTLSSSGTGSVFICNAGGAQMVEVNAAAAITGPIKLRAGTATDAARISLPHGATPVTAVANGDIWTTTAGVFARVNGVTQILGGAGVAVKAWADALAAGGATTAFNVTSIVGSAGSYVVTFTTPMPSASYAVVLGVEATSGGPDRNIGIANGTKTANGFTIQTFDNSNNLAAAKFNFAVFST